MPAICTARCGAIGLTPLRLNTIRSVECCRAHTMLVCQVRPRRALKRRWTTAGRLLPEDRDRTLRRRCFSGRIPIQFWGSCRLTAPPYALRPALQCGQTRILKALTRDSIIRRTFGDTSLRDGRPRRRRARTNARPASPPPACRPAGPGRPGSWAAARFPGGACAASPRPASCPQAGELALVAVEKRL